ncbi:unnamed protein product [Adineta steineri]|uniref:Uncharacterized protein n=2 Tax=Adineta steineri TaxID=433720 RepID=A0A815LD27_9BILA|nr:unnamed protein product [Adineta steineri]CAF1408237.1 unnamed protein product [Adineta steineri]CAF4160837.1 unnamed protein product [Adineta steineri]
MSSSNTYVDSELSRNNIIFPYFIITVTNYPHLIQPIQQYQISNQYWQRPYQGAILIPGVLVHFGINRTEEHERLLRNTVRFRIQEIIRDYLRLTIRPYPFHLIFDMSDMRSHL